MEVYNDRLVDLLAGLTGSQSILTLTEVTILMLWMYKVHELMALIDFVKSQSIHAIAYMYHQ